MQSKILKCTLKALICLLLIAVFVITFVDSPYIPTWSDLFGRAKTFSDDADILTVLDVGQGDSILVQSNGRFGLIDDGDGTDLRFPRRLARNKVKGFDVLMLTHWHEDHTGGTQTVLDRYIVRNFVIPAVPKEDASGRTAQSMIECAQKQGARICNAVPAMCVNIGDFEITTVYYRPEADTENNRSLINIAACHGKKFLLLGDMESTEEEKLLNANLLLDCDVIKIGHHGSKTSSGTGLLKAVTPEFAVISVGVDNQYGHPDHEIISRLNDLSVPYYRTDVDGDVIFAVGDDGIHVSCEK